MDGIASGAQKAISGSSRSKDTGFSPAMLLNSVSNDHVDADDKEDTKEQLQAVVVLATTNCPWDLDEAMDRVHQSNMSKLDEYGKPVLREDGKVLKGPHYKPPNLEDLV